jgi:hypothetical protein
MANSLSLTSASSNAGIFECPNCRQTIDSASTQCRFGSAAIDPAVALEATERMARLNQACSDASFLRTMAIAIFVFIGLMFIPYLTSWLGLVGYWFLTVAIPFMSVRWWVRFHAIRTDDRDFNRARTTVIVISALSGLNLLRFLFFIR